MAVATLRSSASNTATPTMPTGAVSGDLIVVFAYRDAATSPTLPTNWTNIINIEGNPSIRVAYRVYDGVWTMPAFTNAGRTHSFAITTGTYDTTTPIGNSVTAGPTSNNTITWPAFATNVDDDTSLVLRGVVKGRVNSMPTPTAHTLGHQDGTQPAFGTFLSNDRSEPAAATSSTGRNDAHSIAQIEILGKNATSIAANPSLETDASIALGKRKSKTLGQSLETEASIALARAKRRSLALSSETDSAVALGKAKRFTLGVAIETDLARPILRPGVPILPSVETDAAQLLGKQKRRALPLTSEIDTSLAVGRRKVRLLGVPVETETALPLGKRKAKALGFSTETDLSRLIVVSTPNLGPALETDLAMPLGRVKRKAIGIALETEVAGVFTRIFPDRRFSPPTHEEPMQTRERPHNYYRLTEASSIVRIDGVLTSIRHPRSDLLVAAGVEGVDWFLGGHEYMVAFAVGQELISRGFPVG